MKIKLPIIMFIVAFFIDFVTDQHRLLPNIFVYLPDIVAIGIAIFVIATIIANKSLKIPLKYLVTFVAFVYVVISGIVLNDITTESIISGIRNYFKYVFIFLLAFAYDYTESDLIKFFKVILILGLIQVPVSLLQRFVIYSQDPSGDVIRGTLSEAGSLTIIMVSLIIILASLYLKKIISFKILFLTSILLFIPTAINETKSTFIIFPVGLASLFFVMYKDISKKQFLSLVGSGAILLIAYMAFYDALYTRGEGYGFFESMLSENGMLRSGGYNFKGYEVDPDSVLNLEKRIVGEQKDLPTRKEDVGRFDTISIPFQVFLGERKDIVRMFFGFGIGNIASNFGKGGNYSHVQTLGGAGTTITILVWETGVLGMLLFVLLIVMILWDTWKLSRNESESNRTWQVFAAGWFGVMMVTLATLPYNNMFYFPEVAVLIMFFSGLLVARRSVSSKEEC